MAINKDCPKNTASRMLSWMRKDINKRLRIAVESAIEYSPSCKGPIYFEAI